MAMLKYPHGLMKLLSRVVWSEGMHLGPHHFQVQSRYFEDSIQFATSSLWFASYGLAGLELDADALYNGSVSLLHARGILPDGLPFNMPECDDLPLPRAIGDLIPPTRDGVLVLLGIPPLRPNGLNCTLTPQLVIVPLLAFDSDGYRLGQGGGYYDRTLDALRRQGSVFAIGLAYAGQQVDRVPREAHDQPLDAIVSETGYHRVQTKDD